jgi:hypothetical protein
MALVFKNSKGQTVVGSFKDYNPQGFKRIRDSYKAKAQLEAIRIKGATYNSAMRNLDKVLDNYLGEKKTFEVIKTTNEQRTKTNINDGTLKIVETPVGNKDYKVKEMDKYLYFKDINKVVDGKLTTDTEEFQNGSPGTVEYLFKNGAMYLNMTKKGTGNVGIPDSLKKRYFVSWGWFEDHILNSFFQTTSKGDGGKLSIIQELRSVETKVLTKDDPKTKDVDERSTETDIRFTRCHTSKHLYSLGLGSVILPSRHQPKLRQEFTQKQYNFYNTKEKVKLARIRNVYDIIDENFNAFQLKDTIMQQDNAKTKDIDESLFIKTSGIGIIRNMVFPIELIQRHFQNISTVRQGMQSFWADVSNQYGNFWNFQVVQDEDVPGRVGIIDSLLEEEVVEDVSLLANQSDRTTFKDYTFKRGDVDKKYKKMFTFPLYSKDGIVKEFSLSVKLTSKAATLVNYGTNTSILNSVGGGDVKNLGLVAYTFLLKKDRQKALKLDTDLGAPENKSDAVMSDLSFPVDDNGIGIGTDSEDYKLAKPEATDKDFRKLDKHFGIDFKAITEIKADQDEVINKIQSQRFLKQSGIGMYDENGNLTPVMKKHMVYIINYSLHEGDDSNIQRTKPVIPISLDMTLDGIGGLKPGDMFRVDYLPKVYRDFAYFQIFQINHSMGTSGWETKITAQMKLDLAKMRKEGYIQTDAPRDFDLDTITDAMKAFTDPETQIFQKERKKVKDESEAIKKGKEVGENIESNEGVKTLIEGESDDGTIDIYSSILDF